MRLRAGWLVGGVVAVSALLHTALAWRRATPGYFPDEYMYAELGRSLLESGSPLVRGEGSGFVSLLYPVLTAPAWLWDDVGHAYRTIQAFNAVAMSLAAVPAFLLARRLGVAPGLAVGVAALTVAVPELVYSGAVMAEAVAYPLAVAVAWAAVRAVERPSVGAQVLVLALGGLATTARIQLAVLPLCYVLGVLAARRGHEHRLAIAVVGGGLALGVVLALVGSVGIYGDVTEYRVAPLDGVRGFGATAFVLALASGWVLVPGAVLGIVLALARPRGAAETALAVFTVAAVALLLLQAALVGEAGRAQERYALYALPLVFAAFALYASREWPWRRAHALLAAATALVVAVAPLSGWAAGGGSAQSLVLAALRRLETALDDVGLASLVVALGATVSSAVVVGIAFARPRFATGVALALAGAVTLATTAAAFSYQRDSRALLRATFLPGSPSWVDAVTDEAVTLLVAPRSTSADLHSTLFWNRTVDRIALLEGADRPDAFAALEPEVDGAGRLGLSPGPLLVDGHGSTVLLRGARRVAAGPTKTLWQPDGTPQLELLVAGRYFSGLMAAEGGIRAWPAEPGGRIAAWLELELSAPSAVTVEVELPDDRTLSRTVTAPTLVRIPVCSRGVWTASYRSGSIGVVHGTRVGVRASEPRLVADASACDGRR